MTYILVFFINIIPLVGAGGQKLGWTQNFQDLPACEAAKDEIDAWVKTNFKDGWAAPEPKVFAKCFPTSVSPAGR